MCVCESGEVSVWVSGWVNVRMRVSGVRSVESGVFGGKRRASECVVSVCN